MKSVSNDYKASMRGLMRNRSYVKVAFANVNTSASGDGEWVSNGSEWYSNYNTLDYEYAYGSTYATLELNRWTLDGGSIIVSDTLGNDGFISSKMSDANGIFAVNATLTREFSEPFVFPGLTLTFDTRSEEWVRKVTARFYLNNAVIDTQVIEDITSTTIEIFTSAVDIDKIEIEFGQSLPYRRPRLEQVLYGVVKDFTNENLVSTLQRHDVDPLSRRAPNEMFSFSILDYDLEYDPDNPDGAWKYIDVRSPISIQFGYELPDKTLEWLKPDRYMLDSRPTVRNFVATFTGTGLLGSLSGTFYRSKLGSKNFYDMAEEVLLDAGLTLTPQGTNPWVIDESLRAMFTTAALPIDSHMHCLQLIAHACRCRLFTDDDNVIHIRPFGVTVVGIYRGTWTDNGHEGFSEWGSVDRGSFNEYTYATLELNRWELDGSQSVLPGSNPTPMGFVSNILSNSTGAFSPAVVFEKDFDVPHDLPIISLRFDTATGDHPREIVVTYFEGNQVVDMQFITDIASPEVLVTSELARNCTRIEVLVQSGLPYSRVRVSKVYYRETDFTLDFSTIAKDSQSISKIDQLRAVNVAQYFYVAGSTTTLYQETTTETRLHVEFSAFAQNVQVSVTGGTVLSSNIFARAADIELSAGTKTVTITGTTLTESSVIVSKTVDSNGEVDIVENPLITNETMRSALADHVAAYLTMRNTYDADYRGNPELEVGDIIGLQTMFTDEMDALILVDEISFDGALSGKMKVKGLI